MSNANATTQDRSKYELEQPQQKQREAPESTADIEIEKKNPFIPEVAANKTHQIIIVSNKNWSSKKMDNQSDQKNAEAREVGQKHEQEREEEQEQQGQFINEDDNCHHYVYDGQELHPYDSTSGNYSLNTNSNNDNNNNNSNHNEHDDGVKSDPINGRSIKTIKQMRSLDRFPLPFVDPPEMSDEDQMFANFNHFQIIWSDLSYKIEPKWYKKIGFFNHLLACGQSDVSSGDSSATSTTSSSPSAFTDNTPISSPRSPAINKYSRTAGTGNNNDNHHHHEIITNQHQQLEHKSGSFAEPDALASDRSKASLGQETIEIFSHLNGTIKSGQLTAILGPSGAGKTSLLNCLTGKLRKGVSGHVNLVGALGKQLKICTIPQKDHLLDLLTVEENLWFASKIKNPEYGFDHAKNIERVVELLGLKRCRAAKIKKISGGQHKRVSIAQELLSNPDILVLDEPTSGLDSLTCYKTINMLRDLVELSANNEYMKPMAIIVTIHQPQPKVFNLFHHVYILANGGRIIYEGNPTRALDTVLEVTGLQPLEETTTTSSSSAAAAATTGASKDVGANKLAATVAAQNVDPASFLIEIASEEYGSEAIDKLHSYQRDQFYRIHRVADLQQDNLRRAREQLGSSQASSLQTNDENPHQFNNPAFKSDFTDQELMMINQGHHHHHQQQQQTGVGGVVQTGSIYEPHAVFDEKTLSTRSSLSSSAGSGHLFQENNQNQPDVVKQPTAAAANNNQDRCSSSGSSSLAIGDEIDLESALKRRRRSAVYKVNNGPQQQLEASSAGDQSSGKSASRFWWWPRLTGAGRKTNQTQTVENLSSQSAAEYLQQQRQRDASNLDQNVHKFGAGRRASSNLRDQPVAITITTDLGGEKPKHHLNNTAEASGGHAGSGYKRSGSSTTTSSLSGTSSGGTSSSRPSISSASTFLYVSDQLLHTRDSDHKGKFWSHTATLTRRTFLTTRRDPLLMTSRVLFHLMIPILMAHVYGQSTGKANACPNYEPEIDITQIPSLVESKRVESMLEELHMSIENVSMFFIIMYAFSAAVLALNALSFPLNMQVLLKETRNGWYPMSSYVVAKTLADLPLELTMPSITMALVYPLTGQPSSYLEWRMLTICLIMTLCSLIAQTQALIIGALVMNSVQTAVFVSQASQLPWVILAGFTIRIKRLSEPLKLVSLTSFYRLGCEAITLTRYGFGICPCNPKEITGQPVKLVGIPEQVRVMAQHWLESRATSSSSDEAGDNNNYSDDLVGDDLTNSTEITTISPSPTTLNTLSRRTRDILTSTLNPSELINNAVTSLIGDGGSNNGNALLDNTGAVISNNNNSSTLISEHSHHNNNNKADIFQHLANQLSYANSYGVNITSCADVTPDRIRAINLGDNWLVARIWHLFLMLIIMKILLYYAVTFSIRIRL